MRARLGEAVERLIGEARADGKVVRAGPEAARLAQLYDGCGVAPEDIAQLIVRAALALGLPVEIGDE